MLDGTSREAPVGSATRPLEELHAMASSIPHPCLHAGLDPRHGFLPPRLRVERLREDAGEHAWAAVPTVPLFADLAGERVCVRPPRVRLAHDGRALHVRVEVDDPTPVVRRDTPPGHPNFWRQDHVEVRLAPDPTADLDQSQFILTADGRLAANRNGGPIPQAEALRAGGRRTDTGWRAWMGIPFEVVGCGAPRFPWTLRGLVALCRWSGVAPDIVCMTPAVLGFSHSERFAELLLSNEVNAVRLDGVTFAAGPLRSGPQPVQLQVLRTAGRDGDGTLKVLCETGATATPDASEWRTARWELPVKPGGSLSPVPARATVELSLQRPRYTRFGVWWNAPDGSVRELGAVTLRAAPSPLPENAGKRGHPSLFFDAEGMRALREKAQRAFYIPLTQGWRKPFPENGDDPLPDPDDVRVFNITRSCLHWFRVAKETMLRDGAGGKRPAAARIWSLLPPEAQAAFRDVAASVVPSEDQFAVLLPAMNALLRKRDLYEPTAFAEVRLPAVALESLERGWDALSDFERARLNRALLQSAIECFGAFQLGLVRDAGDCAGPWLLSGDARWIGRATRRLEIADRCMIPGPQTHLHEGMLGAQLAFAYDLFFPHLTHTQRNVWRRVMARFLQLYLDTARASAWTVTTIANANPVGNGGSGLLALALLDDFPSAAREARDHARRNVRVWLDYCTGADGGNTEGAQYWQYGLENFLLFAVALERLLGHDDGLLAHPSVRRSMAMLHSGLTNDGALHGVNDTVPMPIGATTAWFMASRYGDRFGQWYGDHAVRWLAARQAAGKPIAYPPDPLRTLLFRAEVPEASEAPPLPTAVWLRDVQVATLRSAPRWDATLVAGLKGSRPPYTHHNQADTGSLWLDVRGERLLIDPGYYKPAGSDHGLPVVGGRSPVVPAAFVGRILRCEEAGELRVAVCDSSAAYGVEGWRVVRHLVLAGSRALVVLDDIVAEEDGKPAEVESLFQCGGPVRSAGAGAVRVQGREASLRLRFHAPHGGSLVTLHPERNLHDSHWGYHFADCRWFPVSVRYRAAGPLVAILADETDASVGPWRVRRTEDRITVTLGSSFRIPFRRTSDGWHVELD